MSSFDDLQPAANDDYESAELAQRAVSHADALLAALAGGVQ